MKGGSWDWGRKSKPIERKHRFIYPSSGAFMSWKRGYWPQKKMLDSSTHLIHYRENSYSATFRLTQNTPPNSQAISQCFASMSHSSAVITACRAGSPGLPATCESLPISGQRNDEKARNTKVLWAEWFSIHCILQKKSQSHTLALGNNNRWLKAILWKYKKLIS